MNKQEGDSNRLGNIADRLQQDQRNFLTYINEVLGSAAIQSGDPKNVEAVSKLIQYFMPPQEPFREVYPEEAEALGQLVTPDVSQSLHQALALAHAPPQIVFGEPSTPGELVTVPSGDLDTAARQGIVPELQEADTAIPERIVPSTSDVPIYPSSEAKATGKKTRRGRLRKAIGTSLAGVVDRFSQDRLGRPSLEKRREHFIQEYEITEWLNQLPTVKNEQGEERIEARSTFPFIRAESNEDRELFLGKLVRELKNELKNGESTIEGEGAGALCTREQLLDLLHYLYVNHAHRFQAHHGVHVDQLPIRSDVGVQATEIFFDRSLLDAIARPIGESVPKSEELAIEQHIQDFLQKFPGIVSWMNDPAHSIVLEGKRHFAQSLTDELLENISPTTKTSQNLKIILDRLRRAWRSMRGAKVGRKIPGYGNSIYYSTRELLDYLYDVHNSQDPHLQFRIRGDLGRMTGQDIAERDTSHTSASELTGIASGSKKK